MIPTEADLADAVTSAVRAFGPALPAWSHEAPARRTDAGSPFSIVGEQHPRPVREPMETALRRLGDARAGVLVLVEVVPDDEENVPSARRLNPPGPAPDAWLG
ncbi:DUF4303 domain-containing protein [Lentzea sp. CC55]|uniref:DUF4303 domain-containing protein n=1 Tax=Lentzea sp. CC55 TaxID=2884909 RepID=UPI0027DF3E2E|nr:DUF4303 domain-containing protein [Lentzea sp. CC55]MCG8923511.1 DUF4303 domain-containing protein [Lentzea sp. CC55]